ncbi:sensor histidine kinase [candidate division KSB1 bacterium]|nr:HAMP domain-containing histidine kinase [candidate division KSB1 bacterium]RQW01570.1 MAG: sensor histidine kinase [candidate division KSB1 bacterium]
MDNEAELGRPIFFIDRDYTIEKTSKNLTRKAGIHDEASLSGSKCHRLFFNFDSPCRNCPVSRAIAFKTAVEEEIKLDPQDAFSFTRHAIATPILDDNSEIQHLIIDCLGDDITIYSAEKHATQSTTYSIDEFENDELFQTRLCREQTKALSAFASRMAHDIKNVLALISTNVDSIVQETQAQAAHLDSNKIAEQAAKIQHHIENIVELVDVANSLKVHNWETIAESDLADMLSRVLTLTQLNQPYAHLDIQLEIADNLPRIITSEIYLERALNELLRSILSNSVENGIVNIHLDYVRDGDYFIFVIRCRQDQNIFDDLRSMIQQFYTQKKSCDKTKIGLLIAYASILVHNGSMNYRLLEDGEFSIVFKLPRVLKFD